MSPPETTRFIHDVQTAVASRSPGTDPVLREHLPALVRAVLSSVDLRDLKGASGADLVSQLEHMLRGIVARKKGEIIVHVHRTADDRIVIETCMEDQPFLVSTMRSLLASEGIEVKRLINGIVPIRRDPAGRIVKIGRGPLESLMRVEAAMNGPLAERFSHLVVERLRLAQAMVRDFEAMKARIQTLADHYFIAAEKADPERARHLREAEALLRWLCDENFVFLSVEQYGKDAAPVEMLGISSICQSTRRPEFIGQDPDDRRLVRFERSAEESPVHRTGKPGYFLFQRFDEAGELAGAFLIHGLFTYKALHTPPEEIPFIRMALRDLLSDRDVRGTSHRGKNITNAFNSLPLEYLLSERRETIWEVTDRILRAEMEGGSDVHIRIDEKGRFAFVIVTLPRSQFSEELRQEVQDVIVQVLGGTYADYGIYIDRYDNAVMHYYVTGTRPFSRVDTGALRDRLLAMARGWSERLREAIRILVGDDEEKVAALYELYVDAFSEEHKRRASVQRLAGDLRCLETLRAGEEIDCDIYVSQFGDHPGSLQLRIFSRRDLKLSEELPVIANFGFDVVDEYSRTVRLAHVGDVDMDNFRIEAPSVSIGHVMGRRSVIIEALRLVFTRGAGDDSLNRLVVASDLDVRDVEILRAYVALLRQYRLPFGEAAIRDALVHHPQVSTALMMDLAARFDQAPSVTAKQARAKLDGEIQRITDFTADRILSAVAAVVRATVRTNAYLRRQRRGEAYAFKIASSELPFGPSPKPFREIWVYHTDFEGVHLRGGKVARGGIRFSDRPEDFRTEIHDLMATQMVKNVVIVPVGAKGGFVLRHPPSAPEHLRAAGDHYYRAFIGAMLSLTDNVVNGKVVVPEGIRYTEAPDPYLVVAADKGTAHLSDTANAISMARGYWLDDAFASGGSHGYDHKKTGITARGAWEVAKRSFRELGIDPERDVVTAVGVGDMSGDVFGNGMLRSRTIKLLAAFNHRHIFLDPAPDPERSYEERKRLFDLGRSQWTDYDPKVLSAGGGVYPRDSKEVPLSEAARAMLGVPDGRPMSGHEVIRAILTMPVDLLWMGGIGTYVRSREESDADVMDKANDDARVTADKLRCKVLAEGANLSITDRGRVAFAKRGGQNYSAFIDNSGGVDASDHEVNIKILFSPLLADEKVTRQRRNEILERAEPEVVEAVLANNRAQSRMVSYDARRSRRDVYRYARTMRFLVEKVPFDPDAFALPGDDELAVRSRKKVGLYKCEAAVLCAHAKMLVYRDLLEAQPLDEAVTAEMVRRYFPPAVLSDLGPLADEALLRHLLRREIATTMLVNHIIDNAGASLFPELMMATGCTARDIAQGYWFAAESAGVSELLAHLFAMESPTTQSLVYDAMALIQAPLEDAIYYLMDQAHVPALDGETMGEVRRLVARVPDIVAQEAEDRARAPLPRAAMLVAEGIDERMAERIGALSHLTACLDATRLADKIGTTSEEALVLRMRVSEAMRFGRLRAAIDRIVLANPWDGPAVHALGRHLEFHLHKLVVLAGRGGSVEGLLERYHLGAIRAQVGEYLERGVDIPALVMLDDQLRRFLPAELDIP